MFPQQRPWENGDRWISQRLAQADAQRGSNSGGGVFWRGADGRVWVKGHRGTNAAGNWDGNTINYWSSRGYQQIADPVASRGRAQGGGGRFYARGGGGGGGYGGGYAAPPKKLDQAQIDSLAGLLGVYDIARDTKRERARLTRDARLNEKRSEREKEKKKWGGKKTANLQEFGAAKTTTDINTRNTLENLVSSLSTMGLGGSRALARQILDAANRSNRQANATQAKNAQALDSAWNEFDEANKNDQAKINDQYNYDIAEADREWGQNRQNALYKIADVYNAAGQEGGRNNYMKWGNDLNATISNARFLNPQYTGVTRTMATPELSDYSQDIAQYNTGDIGEDGTADPNSADNTTSPGNLALKALAVNNKDLGVKRKTEGDISYGV